LLGENGGLNVDLVHSAATSALVLGNHFLGNHCGPPLAADAVMDTVVPVGPAAF
jgi:hypothetical protein